MEESNLKDEPVNYYGYMVYENGDIMGKRNKILKPRDNGEGYNAVVLYIGDSIKNMKVHRLVAICYIENPLNKPQVNHKNGIKKDNRVENLEWATQSENIRHADSNGLRIPSSGESNGMSKLCKKDVDSIRYLYHECNLSKNELSSIFNVTSANIYSIVNNKTWVSKDLTESFLIDNKYINTNISVKLKISDIHKIIEMYKTGLCSQKQISLLYNVDRKRITKILNNKKWKI